MRATSPCYMQSAERSGAARSSRYDRQRARILHAATVLVNEKGVGGTTLIEVAQALELTPTSITYYFRYKEQLVAAVFGHTLERLAQLANEASCETSPEKRISRYVHLFIEQTARSLRGQAMPLAALSEIRSLDEGIRKPLLMQYQQVFRTVRGFFGAIENRECKLLFTAKAQILNEALFWATVWLRDYPLNDFGNVERRMLDILVHGIATPGRRWSPQSTSIDDFVPPELRGDFLRVATRLVNDFGYRGASIDRIAGELKVTKGAFYHHIQNKDELIIECFRNSFRRLARLQRAIEATSRDTWSRLASGLSATLSAQFEGEYPILRNTALQALPEALRGQILARCSRLTLWLAGILGDGMRDGSVRIVDPTIAAHIVVSSIDGAYDLKGWSAAQNRVDAVTLYAGIILGGLFPDIGAKEGSAKRPRS